MTTASVKLQLGVATLAVAATASLSPVVAQADSFALAPALAAPAQVLTWGSDDLDPALLAQMNEARQAAAVGADAVGAYPPGQLWQYLVQGIVKGTLAIVRGGVVVVGTTTFVAVAFTGGLITAIGNILPGWIGDVVTNVGDATTNVANRIAEALRVGPYGTTSIS